MEVASADLVYLNTPQLSVVEDSVFGSWNNHYERYPPGNVTKDTGLKIVNQKWSWSPAQLLLLLWADEMTGW